MNCTADVLFRARPRKHQKMTGFAKSVHVAKFAPAGTPGCEPRYQLSHSDTKTLASRMIGIPVTYDHRGIESALKIVDAAGAPLTKPNVMRGLAKASEADPKQRPIGLVQDAWVAANGDGMCTFSVQGEAAKSMIEAGNLGAVSLTHVAGSLQPLELSICNVPARPGSKVVFKSIAGPQQAAAYKAYTLQRSQTAAAETPATIMPETRSSSSTLAAPPVAAAAAAAAVPSQKDAAAPDVVAASNAKMTLQQALALLPEEARATLADKFSAQADNLTKASAELKDAKDKLKVTEDFNKTECALLTEQLNLLLAQMPDDLRKMYSPNVPKLVDSFASGDPRACMDAAFRTITCASRALQIRDATAAASAAPPATKRMRGGDSTPQPTAMAVEEEEEGEDAAAEPAKHERAEVKPLGIVAAAAAPRSAAPPAMSSLDRLNAALGMAFD